MELPLGVPDPIFLCDLALELKMPVSEIGERMSAHELGVVWPAYFRYRHRLREREEAKHESRSGRVR
jgi:hypothetical protein